MQVFVPYQAPLDVARCLDPKRLNKQIVECQQILDAIDRKSDAWKNHPVTKMYYPYKSWLQHYLNVLSCFKKGDFGHAEWWNKHANYIRPAFLTEEFCNQHKRRLYTKAPGLYPQFEEFGKTEENWYFLDGGIVKYINGKRI